jgi:hypothetical protein
MMANPACKGRSAYRRRAPQLHVDAVEKLNFKKQGSR